MVSEYDVEGYKSFKKLITVVAQSVENVYVYFYGSCDASGESWCPDCKKAGPVTKKVMSKLPDTVHILYVSVGNKEEWKDPECPFRTDEELHLKSIPTLIKWKGEMRLENDEDFSKENLEKILLKK